MGLQRVVELCVAYCREQLAPSVAISWLVQAETHMLEPLRALTLAYVKREFRRIRMVARESLALLVECPSLTLEVMDSI
jgi:hypothetical protein